MSNLPTIAAEANEPEQLIHVRRDGTEVLVVTYAEARQLVGELAATLLHHTRMPIQAALATLLDDLAAALHRRGL